MQKKTDINTKRKLIFYVWIVALPILQYLIFYVYVNFNAIIMSLQEYKIVDNRQVYVFNYNDDNNQHCNYYVIQHKENYQKPIRIIRRAEWEWTRQAKEQQKTK